MLENKWKGVVRTGLKRNLILLHNLPKASLNATAVSMGLLRINNYFSPFLDVISQFSKTKLFVMSSNIFWFYFVLLGFHKTQKMFQWFEWFACRTLLALTVVFTSSTLLVTMELEYVIYKMMLNKFPELWICERH